jgi:hypothetical protein
LDIAADNVMLLIKQVDSSIIDAIFFIPNGAEVDVSMEVFDEEEMEVVEEKWRLVGKDMEERE